MEFDSFCSGKLISDMSQEERLELTKQIFEAVFKVSKIANLVGRKHHAEQLAHLVFHQRYLMERERRGELPAEEARTIPGVGSNITRMLTACGMCTLKDEGLFGED